MIMRFVIAIDQSNIEHCLHFYTTIIGILKSKRKHFLLTIPD